MIQTINEIIKLATHEINQNSWINANYHLKQGLNILGFRYKPRYKQLNVIYAADDSSTALVIANDFEKRGQLARAAHKRMDILKSRFDQFKLNFK
jgi:hypothetical protein